MYMYRYLYIYTYAFRSDSVLRHDYESLYSNKQKNFLVWGVNILNL